VLTRSRARLRASALLLLIASIFGAVFTASPAQAATGSWRSQVAAEASKHRGAPYQWGAAGPSRFDCSGFTMYVYKHFGKSLPHQSSQQYASMHHVAKNQKVPGDLLFFRNSSGRISHVAIYAGPSRMEATKNKPMMWHSPHSGDVVKVVPIYSSNYVVGRL
jgi:cell wall-associated NlpC family hydrolase